MVPFRCRMLLCWMGFEAQVDPAKGFHRSQNIMEAEQKMEEIKIERVTARIFSVVTVAKLGSWVPTFAVDLDQAVEVMFVAHES